MDSLAGAEAIPTGRRRYGMLAHFTVASVVFVLTGCERPQPFDTDGAYWPPDKPAAITIHADRALGPVNRLVFGSNVEASDPKGIFTDFSNPVPGRTGDGLWDAKKAQPVPEALEFALQTGMRMLRYPGGCLEHNFDWKEAVGPADTRPDKLFGIGEFLAFCRAVDAEPLITVSAYRSNPEDAARLVEYLNAPADPDHPWALKRAEWGRPEPFHVTYFEIGNEVDHGNHNLKPARKFTPKEYGELVNSCARAMRQVDSTVKVGAIMRCTEPDNEWNRTVLSTVKGSADFVIVHTYAVGVWGEGMVNAKDSDRAMRACMAAGDQIEADLAQYRALIRRQSGRDIPLAITEYNASFVQDRPKPFRFSLGAALFSADYVRVMLKPETGVLMANYWHFINGYWGMVHGPRVPGEDQKPWKRMPAFYLYRLWGAHFGTTLVDVEVDSPLLEFEGFRAVKSDRRNAGPAAGKRAFPAYAALTASAGLSSDGSVLYLMVFNKHHARPLRAQIHVKGRGIASGKAWTVTGPSLDADNLGEDLVRETVTGNPIAPPHENSFAHTFPPCSMTAFELAGE